MTTSAARISVEDYRGRLQRLLTPPAPAEVRVADSVGLALADAVYAARSAPLFDNAAMDGFALPRDVVAAGAPVSVAVTAEVNAGDAPPDVLTPGTAHQIMTGAALAPGTVAVVPVEHTSGFVGAGGHVDIREMPPLGAHIRIAGEDLSAGALLLPAGTVMDARRASALAGVGHSTVMAMPRTRALVISTGSELIAPSNEIPAPGKIFESNGLMIAGLLAEAGLDVVACEVASDQPGKVRDIMERYRGRADLVVTTGGISAGTQEAVKLAFANELEFVRVAMRPGGPQGCGSVDGLPIVSLPGNPVAAFCSLEMLLRPVLRQRMGLPPDRTVIQVDWVADPERSRRGWSYIMAQRSENGLVEAGSGRSGSLATLAWADLLVICPPGADGPVRVNAIDLNAVGTALF